MINISIGIRRRGIIRGVIINGSSINSVVISLSSSGGIRHGCDIRSIGIICVVSIASICISRYNLYSC